MKKMEGKSSGGTGKSRRESSLEENVEGLGEWRVLWKQMWRV